MTAGRIRLAIALSGAVLLAGCGGSGSSDADKVKQALTRELSAIATGDTTTACSLATPSGQAKLAKAIPGGTCKSVVALVSQHLSAQVKVGLRSAQIRRVTINGDTALVRDADITSTRGTLSGFIGPGSAHTMLKKQPDGSWKLSG